MSPHPVGHDELLRQVTMLVPTRNRQGYLQNILETYGNTPLQLIVADTSPAPLRGVERYANVRYHHFTECRFIDKLQFLVDSAATEHVVMRAENRHLTLHGIARCTQHLLGHPDCTLAHGAHVWVRQKHGRLESWPCYNADSLAGLLQDRPEDRLLAAFDPMVSLYYAVEKRQNLLDVLRYAPGIENLNAFEMLLTAIKAINGKCARVPVLFCAVQERPSALKSPRLYDGFDTVASAPEYAEQHRCVVSGIASHLALRSGLPAARAEEITRASLAKFLSCHCAKKVETAGERLRRKAKRFVDSALRRVGLPDTEAQQTLDRYLGSLEGDGRAEFDSLLAVIARGYKEGW
jgi:glycosyltransferase domain-containing protein